MNATDDYSLAASGDTNQQNDASTICWKSVLGPDLLGYDTAELCQLTHSLQQYSRRCLRLRCELPAFSLPFQVQPVDWYSRGRWIIDPELRPGAFLHHAAGDYYIQDAASMLALALCQVQPGQSVCDLCAAPGGKATGLLEQLAGTGFLVANDVIRSRLEILQLALSRTGWANHVTTSLDVQRMAVRMGGQFDCVLVDAPCSGQSMVARDKQSLASFSQAQIQHSAARQWRILQSAAELVRPGGRLVYSTCTFSVAENEHQIEKLLEYHSDWRIAPMPGLERWSSPRLAGCYRLWPHRDHCDGSFAAAVVRPADSQPQPASCSSALKTSKSRWQPWRAGRAELAFLRDGQLEFEDYLAWQKEESIHLFSKSLTPLIPYAHSGQQILQLLPGRIEPSYGSAVLTYPALTPTEQIELDNQQACQFMAGESLRPSQDNQGNGWCQVRWQGRALAWGKMTGGVLKNHLPKLLRQPGLRVEA